MLFAAFRFTKAWFSGCLNMVNTQFFTKAVICFVRLGMDCLATQCGLYFTLGSHYLRMQTRRKQSIVMANINMQINSDNRNAVQQHIVSIKGEKTNTTTTNSLIAGLITSKCKPWKWTVRFWKKGVIQVCCLYSFLWLLLSDQVVHTMLLPSKIEHN